MFLAIEGVMGVGKTSTARILCSALKGFTLILEEYRKNPFIHVGNENLRRQELEKEIAFLLIHQRQLLPAGKNVDIVADFHLSKSEIYTRLTLSKTERRVFNELYRHIRGKAISPDLIIYLKGPTKLILNRIEKRRRMIEKWIDSRFIEKLSSLYDEYMDKSRLPRVTFNIDQYDFRNDYDARRYLIDTVTTKIRMLRNRKK